MNKAEFVENLKSSGVDDLFPHFRNAFLACLSPEEICNFLDLNFIQAPALRKLILDKICLSMKNDFLSYHEQLLDALLDLMAQKKCSNRSSVAFCLNQIADVAPQVFREKIIKIFLDSSLIGIRKRGYNLLLLHWNTAFETQIATIWHKNRDLITAKLIIEKFPSEFLELHFAELESQLTQRYRIRVLLYKRTYPSSAKYLAKLAQEDGITYAYICAEIGIVFSRQEAKQLAYRYATDERVGILIWALGVMKRWDILTKMYNNAVGGLPARNRHYT